MKKLLYLTFLTISISTCSGMYDPTKISSAEQSYYEDNREWDYLEKILIKKLEKIDSKTNTKINKIATGAFFIPLALFSYAYRDNINDISSFAITETLATLASSFCAVIIKTIGESIFRKKIRNERFANVLEMFLQKYNPEANSVIFLNDEINYKNIIPQELHKTFDALHKKYKIHGKEYLEKNSIEILESITDKITYEIKKKKYKAIRKDRIARNKNINRSRNTSILASAIA